MGSRTIDADRLLRVLEDMNEQVAHVLYEDAIDAVKRLIEEGSPADQPQGQQGSLPSGGPAAPLGVAATGRIGEAEALLPYRNARCEAREAALEDRSEPPPGYWVGEALGQDHAARSGEVPWGIVVDGLECLVMHCGSTSDAMAACASHRDAVLASHRPEPARLPEGARDLLSKTVATLRAGALALRQATGPRHNRALKLECLSDELAAVLSRTEDTHG